jgi:hypothetical protein
MVILPKTIYMFNAIPIKANGPPPKQSVLAILISYKVYFKPKLVRRDKEGHLILIKGVMHQEEITNVNFYVTYIGALNFIKHTLLDLKTQLSPQHSDVRLQYSSIMNRCHSDQKLTKKNLELNDNIDLLDLTDIYRVLHPVTAQYTFFSVDHGTFSKIDHILGYKASLNKYKKIKITPPTLLTEQNTIKLQLNNKRNYRK